MSEEKEKEKLRDARRAGKRCGDGMGWDGWPCTSEEEEQQGSGGFSGALVVSWSSRATSTRERKRQRRSRRTGWTGVRMRPGPAFLGATGHVTSARVPHHSKRYIYRAHAMILFLFFQILMAPIIGTMKPRMDDKQIIHTSVCMYHPESCNFIQVL